MSQTTPITAYQDPSHLQRMAHALDRLCEEIGAGTVTVDRVRPGDAEAACKLGSAYIDAKRAAQELGRMSGQEYASMRKKTARLFTVDSLLLALSLSLNATTFRRIVTLLADRGTGEAIAGIERAAMTHLQYQATAQMVLRNTAANAGSIEALARIAITGGREQRITAIRNLGQCHRGTVIAPLCRIILADPQYGAHARIALMHIGNLTVAGKKVLTEENLDILAKADALTLLAQTHKFDAMAFVNDQMRRARGVELAQLAEVALKVQHSATLLRPSQQDARDYLLRAAGGAPTGNPEELLRPIDQQVDTEEPAPRPQGVVNWLKSLVGAE